MTQTSGSRKGGIKIFIHYHGEYEKVYPERFEKEYGYLSKRVIQVIYKFLDCGILEHGMARVYCKECGHDYFVAFSCKTRFMCPSCTQKSKLIWTDWVNNQVDKNITIPKTKSIKASSAIHCSLF